MEVTIFLEKQKRKLPPPKTELSYYRSPYEETEKEKEKENKNET
jgi:hypothetical protein